MEVLEAPVLDAALIEEFRRRRSVVAAYRKPLPGGRPRATLPVVGEGHGALVATAVGETTVVAQCRCGYVARYSGPAFRRGVCRVCGGY